MTATVTWAGTGKKTSFKNGLADATGAVTTMTSGSDTLDLMVGEIGLTGTLDGYTVDGARNVFSAKDAYAKTVAAAVTAAWKGNYTLAWSDGSGLNVFTLTVAARGKTTLSGTLANGKKTSATAQMIVGADGEPCVIPVVVTRNVQLAFTVRFEGGAVSVSGIGGAVIAPVAGLVQTCRVSCDADGLAQAVAATQTGVVRVMTEFLPEGMSVAQSGTKWIVAGGAKTGRVAVDKTTGEIDAAKSKTEGYNVPALKFTYTAKTGAFKGSFKVYYLYSNGRAYSVKNVAMTVSGVTLDGVGYGTMTNRKVGTFDFNIK